MTKKTAERDVVPTIRSIVPPALPAGSPIEAAILGVGMVTPGGDDQAHVLLVSGTGDSRATAELTSFIRDRGQDGGVQRITFKVHAGIPAGKHHIVVVGPTGRESDPGEFEVTSP